LKSIIDSFAAPFEAHMKAEIDSLLALDMFDGEPLVKAYDAMEASIIGTADKVRYSLLFSSLPFPPLNLTYSPYFLLHPFSITGLDVNTCQYRLFPLVMGSRDVTYEGGIHHWPPIPFFVPYLVHWYFERKHAGAWRFSPSDTFGRPRALKFLPSL
jgi:hypothetical protein